MQRNNPEAYVEVPEHIKVELKKRYETQAMIEVDRTAGSYVHFRLNDGHRCHLFLKDGKLEFCNDCQHELAGQTVELPDLPDWLL